MGGFPLARPASGEEDDESSASKLGQFLTCLPLRISYLK